VVSSGRKTKAEGVLWDWTERKRDRKTGKRKGQEWVGCLSLKGILGGSYSGVTSVEGEEGSRGMS